MPVLFLDEKWPNHQRNRFNAQQEAVLRALQLVSERDVSVRDVPAPPPPGEGEVQLKIKVVALNHIDVWGWRGMAFAKRNLPMTVGAEASAEVATIGPGVSGFKTGDLVSIYGAPTCGLCKPFQQGIVKQHVLNGAECNRSHSSANIIYTGRSGY